MRALPADLFEYLGLTALGNTAFPTATGAAGVVVVGCAPAAGAAVASAPHCAFRKSFHFIPLRVPAALAALYFALHSLIESAWAELLCIAMTLRSVTAHRAMRRVIIQRFLS